MGIQENLDFILRKPYTCRGTLDTKLCDGLISGESPNYLINDPMIPMIKERPVIETFVLPPLFDIMIGDRLLVTNIIISFENFITVLANWQRPLSTPQLIFLKSFIKQICVTSQG